MSKNNEKVDMNTLLFKDATLEMLETQAQKIKLEEQKNRINKLLPEDLNEFFLSKKNVLDALKGCKKDWEVRIIFNHLINHIEEAIEESQGEITTNLSKIENRRLGRKEKQEQKKYKEELEKAKLNMKENENKSFDTSIQSIETERATQ